MTKTYLIIIPTLFALGVTGCTSPIPTLKPRHSIQYTTTTVAPVQYAKPTPQKIERYQQTMRTVASGIKDDPNYHRIALDTPEKKAWFKDLTYKLWDRQITRQQFLTQGVAKYPTHQYELQFIINGFDKIAN